MKKNKFGTWMARFLAAVILLSGMPVTPQTAAKAETSDAATFDTSGIYIIYSPYHSDLYWKMYKTGKKKNDHIELKPYDGTVGCFFRFTDAGDGYYGISYLDSNLYIDTESNNGKSGKHLHNYSKKVERDNQKFKFIKHGGNYYIQCKKGNIYVGSNSKNDRVFTSKESYFWKVKMVEQEFTDSEWKYKILGDHKAGIVGRTSKDAKVKIPDSVTFTYGDYSEKMSVTKVNLPDDKAITDVEIPEGVETLGMGFTYSESEPTSSGRIGKNGFRYCSNLKTIRIPSSVKKIEAGAFEGCLALENIKISSSASKLSIGERAFRRCDALTDVSISATKVNVGKQAFFQCRALEKISINASEIILYEEAFSDCTSLTDFEIPESAEVSPLDSIFKGCKSLKKIALNNCDSRNFWTLFVGCTSLEEVSLETTDEIKQDTSEKITAYGLFRECYNLKKATLPEKLSVLDAKMFVNMSTEDKACEANIYLPDGIEEIKGPIFEGYEPGPTLWVHKDSQTDNTLTKNKGKVKGLESCIIKYIGIDDQKPSETGSAIGTGSVKTLIILAVAIVLAGGLGFAVYKKGDN